MIFEIFLYLLLTIVIVFYYYLTWNFDFWRKRRVSGPKPRLIFGTLPSVFNQKRSLAYTFDEIYKKYKKSNGYVGLFNGRHPELLIIEPDLVREVLIKSFKNFHDNAYFSNTDEDDSLAGQNPFGACGDRWKKIRTEITPALTFNRVKNMYPIIQSVTKTLTNYIENRTKNQLENGFDAKDMAARFTIDVVTSSVFGIEGDALKNDKSICYEEGKYFMSHANSGLKYMEFLATIIPIDRFFSRFRISQRTENYFTQLTNEAVKIRRNSNINRADFLDHLLKLQEKQGFGINHLTSHCMTFFTDGFETSSLLIAHCLLLLGRYPKTQDRLRLELNNAIGEDGTIPFEILMELPYLEQCVYETLRIFPLASSHAKSCTEPTDLISSKGKAAKIPKGITVLIPTYSLHHDEEYYPNPEIFNPDRFNSEFGGIKKFRDLGVLIPFGDGPRICVGMKFGLAQSKAAIVEIVRNWQIEVNKRTRADNEIDPNYFITILQGGIWLNFKRISK